MIRRSLHDLNHLKLKFQSVSSPHLYNQLFEFAAQPKMRYLSLQMDNHSNGHAFTGAQEITKSLTTLKLNLPLNLNLEQKKTFIR